MVRWHKYDWTFRYAESNCQQQSYVKYEMLIADKYYMICLRWLFKRLINLIVAYVFRLSFDMDPGIIVRVIIKNT